MNQLFEINLTVPSNTTIMKKISLLLLFFPLLSQEYIWPTNTGKHLSSSKANISLPTAPLDPRIATVRGLFGRRNCGFKLDEEN